MRTLEARERRMILGGALLLLLLGLAAAVTLWRAGDRAREARIATRRDQLREARQLAGQIAALRGGSASAAARLQAGAGGGLAATLETLVAANCGRASLVATRPLTVTPPAGLRQECLELQLEKVRLDQLVRLLHALDQAPAALQNDALKVRARFEDPALLDATLTVSAFSRSVP